MLPLEDAQGKHPNGFLIVKDVGPEELPRNRAFGRPRTPCGRRCRFVGRVSLALAHRPDSRQLGGIRWTHEDGLSCRNRCQTEKTSGQASGESRYSANLSRDNQGCNGLISYSRNLIHALPPRPFRPRLLLITCVNCAGYNPRARDPSAVHRPRLLIGSKSSAVRGLSRPRGSVPNQFPPTPLRERAGASGLSRRQMVRGNGPSPFPDGV